MLHSAQPRVVKIEAAAPDLSFDQLLRGLVVRGSGIVARDPDPAKGIFRFKS